MDRTITPDDGLCTKELNKQLKVLQARVTQTENDIIAHHQGISTLVRGLLGTPAAAAATLVLPFYNFIPNSFNVLQKLIEYLPSPIEMFKKFTFEMAMESIDSMVDILEKIVGQVIPSLQAAVDALVGQIEGIEGQIHALERQLLSAPAGAVAGIQSQIDALTGQLDGLYDSLQTATDKLARATNFIQSQIDQAQCKISSVRYHR